MARTEENLLPTNLEKPTIVAMTPAVGLPSALVGLLLVAFTSRKRRSTLAMKVYAVRQKRCYVLLTQMTAVAELPSRLPAFCLERCWSHD